MRLVSRLVSLFRASLLSHSVVLVPLITGLFSVVGPGTRRHLIGSTEAATGRKTVVKLLKTKYTVTGYLLG